MVETPSRHRSVNDYASREALKAALLSNMVRNPSTSSIDSSTENSLGVLTEDSEHTIPTADNDNILAHDERDWIQNVVNPETQSPQTVACEIERLMVLKSYMILDTRGSTKETQFASLDRLTDMARRVFGVETVGITLVDLGRINILAGLEVHDTPRKGFFCAHTILSKADFTVINDTTKDVRFADHPFVIGPANLRFYAATPLVSPEGYRLGAFCLLDSRPWPQGLTEFQKATLKDMASLAMEAIENHKTIQSQQRQLHSSSQRLASAAHDLLTPLTGLQLSLSLLDGDSDLKRNMQPHQQEIMTTANSCTEVMVEICESFRLLNGGNESRACLPMDETIEWPVSASTVPEHEEPEVQSYDTDKPGSASTLPKYQEPEVPVFGTNKLMHRLHQVMAALPTQVPLSVAALTLLPPIAVGDEVSIFRAALNLLTNSCERTTAGFVRMNIRVTEVAGSQSELVFECEDSGPSICIEEQKNLTDKIAAIAGGVPWEELMVCSGRYTTSMKWSVSSMFSLVSHIHSLGGTFGFSSSDDVPGRNPHLSTTRFWFSIPLFVPDTALREDLMRDSAPREGLKRVRSVECLFKSSSTNNLISSLRTKNALIIDDSIVIRKTIARALSKLGYETLQAADGMEGLQRMQQSTYDLVMCDFLMPVMDGFDCVREYRRWERENRPGFSQYIAGISAHASGKDSERGIAIGMNIYIPKPVTLKNLVDLQSNAGFTVASEMLDETHFRRDEGRIPSAQLLKTCPGVMSVYDDTKVCLLCADESSLAQLDGIITCKGWKIVAASSDADALSLLKSRNWEAVVLDGQLFGASCVREFRDWEQQNRIYRQRNLYLMTTGFDSFLQTSNSVAMITLPPGFDGAVGKPVKAEEIEALLRLAEEPCKFEAEDFIITE
jgi:CheY-like chemotaxis protein/GAF domain-containing protein